MKTDFQLFDYAKYGTHYLYPATFDVVISGDGTTSSVTALVPFGIMVRTHQDYWNLFQDGFLRNFSGPTISIFIEDAESENQFLQLTVLKEFEYDDYMHSNDDKRFAQVPYIAPSDFNGLHIANVGNMLSSTLFMPILLNLS